MTFTLTINGENPAELLTALQQLNTTQRPQSGAAAPQEKPKAPAPAKQKKPAAAPAEKQPETPADPTTAQTSAPDEPQASGPAQTAPSEETVTAPSAEQKKDPATEGKIRDLIMALMRQGKRAECQKIITDTGAKGISSLSPDSYTIVWEQLLKLKDEVDSNAAG